jgi:hypothetical protein
VLGQLRERDRMELISQPKRSTPTFSFPNFSECGDLMIVTKNCAFCNKEYDVKTYPSREKKNWDRFCSKECRYDFQKKQVLIKCDVCKIEFHRRLSKVKDFNFCSRICKEKAQSLNGGTEFSEMRPLHYGKDESSVNTYRDDALEFYGEACTVCKYSIVLCLEVHHRDGNRSHNSIENLDVLCATHHKEYQFGIRKY